jgi:hypothetical protein
MLVRTDIYPLSHDKFPLLPAGDAPMANDTDPQGLKLPAPYVNKVQVLVAGTNIRMAFAEGLPGQQINYRSAVVISSQDALNLVDELLKAIRIISPPLPTPATGAFFGLGTPTGTPSTGILGALLDTYPGKPKDV